MSKRCAELHWNVTGTSHGTKGSLEMCCTEHRGLAYKQVGRLEQKGSLANTVAGTGTLWQRSNNSKTAQRASQSCTERIGVDNGVCSLEKPHQNSRSAGKTTAMPRRTAHVGRCSPSHSVGLRIDSELSRERRPLTKFPWKRRL